MHVNQQTHNASPRIILLSFLMNVNIIRFELGTFAFLGYSFLFIVN
uniref:Uncharacterized protein n=1 Tax=Rhizophora mucronata TaxID=61149 RepID=A0A2P2P5K1_RHIMU